MNVYVSSNAVIGRRRNRRESAGGGSTYSVGGGSVNPVVYPSWNTLLDKPFMSLSETDFKVEANVLMLKHNLTPLIIPFASQYPELSDYPTNYADTYGQNPKVKCVIVDGSIEYEAYEKAITEKSAGVISRIYWELSEEKTGYIYIVGDAPDNPPVTVPTEYAHQEVIGTSNITSTGSEVDMANMSVTFTPKGKKIHAFFSAPFHTTEPNMTFTVFININGTNVRKSKINLHTNDQVVSFQKLASVTPGVEVTVKIRWNAVNIQQLGSTGSERILTILDLP